MKGSAIKTSAPGRICLFGEHQDYLGLPVVAMAIDLRFHISFMEEARDDFAIEAPDLSTAVETLDPDAPEPRFHGDFLWGVCRVLRDEGFSFPRRGRIVMTSGIPVRAGCSSSSAMTAAFLRLLLEIGEHADRVAFVGDPERMAYLTYRAEKVLFGGAGGMMDQYSCYIGGLIHVFPKSGAVPYGVEILPGEPEDLLLIDSGVPKDTQGILIAAGNRARSAIAEVEREYSAFDIRTTGRAELARLLESGQLRLSETSALVALDHLLNRDLCVEGLDLLRAGVRDTTQQKRLGELLNEEHRILSETLQISTPRIDELVRVAQSAGAAGAKINGSGGGGTAFCYAPGAIDSVEQALQAAGAKTFRVRSAEGARIERDAVDA